MKTTENKIGTKMRWIGSLALACSATAVSLALTVLVGLKLGQSPAEKWVLIGVGVIAVLGTHFLLALIRECSARLRAMTMPVVLICAAYVTYNHATLFLLMQQEAGASRVASAWTVQMEDKPKRDLSVIFSDQASIRSDLVRMRAVRCEVICSTLRAKIAYLEGRSDALTAEADAVRHWTSEIDRRQLMAESFRKNPVAVLLEKLIGMEPARFDLLTSLLFFAVLDVTGGFCWYVAFQLWPKSVSDARKHRVTDTLTGSMTGSITSVAAGNEAGDATDAVTGNVTASVTDCMSDTPNTSRECSNRSLATAMVTQAEVNADQPGVPAPRGKNTQLVHEQRLLELVEECVTGKLWPTVEVVQARFRCGRQKAAKLAREAKVILSEKAPIPARV